MSNEKSYQFNFESKHYNNLMQSLVGQAYDQYGLDCYYLPLDELENDDIDGVWGEIIHKNFSKMYGLRMMAEDTSMMAGQDVFSKFGLSVQDEIVLYVTRKEFHERVFDEEYDLLEHVEDGVEVYDDHDKEPKIGDLVYVKMFDSLFTLTFIERHENMVHGNKFTYKLNCKKYQVTESENIDIVEVGSDKQDIIDTINAIDDDKKQKVADALTYDVDETGYEPNNTDDFANDNVAHEAKKIRDEESDIFGDW